MPNWAPRPVVMAMCSIPGIELLHEFYPVNCIDRAIEAYEGSLGVQVDQRSEEVTWLAFTGPGSARLEFLNYVLGVSLLDRLRDGDG